MLNRKLFRGIKARCIRALKVGLGRFNAGSHWLNVFSDDTFITSYPKSGNTWVRFILANLMFPDREIEISDVERLIPDIYKRSNSKLLEKERPRFLKSHEPFVARYPRVIYVVRDVRSVVVSYYYYHLKMGEIDRGVDWHEYTEMFVSGELDPFGTWNQHVRSWCATCKDKDKFLLVRYEDLDDDPIKTVGRMCEFLGWSVERDEIVNAVRASSFENMKKKEENAGADWEPTKHSDRDDIPFMRSGKTDEWKDELPREVILKIEERWEDTMSDLGYDLI